MRPRRGWRPRWRVRWCSDQAQRVLSTRIDRTGIDGPIEAIYGYTWTYAGSQRRVAPRLRPAEPTARRCPMNLGGQLIAHDPGLLPDGGGQ